MASAQNIVAFNDECESVRDSEWICDFDTRPVGGDVADHTTDATAIIEDDGPRLQGPTALCLSSFDHGQIGKGPG